MQYFERIKAIIEHKNISVSEFSQKTEIHEKSMYNYIAGKTEPSITKIEKIVIAYPDINSHWLLTGMGDMLLEGSAVEEKQKIYIKAHNYNAGNMQGDMNVSPSECKLKLALAMVEIGYLKDKLNDKEEIITLLKNKL